MAFLLIVGQIAVAQEVSRKVARDRADADERAEEAIAEFLATVDGGQEILDKAAGYAAFRVTKAGLGVSGAGGTGIAFNKESGEHVYMNMASAGVGFTFGASRYHIFILFETVDRLDTFKTGGWDSAATAQAAAGSDRAECAGLPGASSRKACPPTSRPAARAEAPGRWHRQRSPEQGPEHRVPSTRPNNFGNP